MLTKIWTSLCLSAASACLVAWFVSLLHEHGFRPACSLVQFFRKQSKFGRLVFAALFLGLWVYAANKPDAGGNDTDGNSEDIDEATNVQQNVGFDLGMTISTDGMQSAVSPLTIARATTVDDGVLLQPLTIDEKTEAVALAGTQTATHAVRQLTDDDFQRGFVLTRIGTGESFDFSPPSNATVCADWRAFGAAEDWTYLGCGVLSAECGVWTNALDRPRVYSFGKVDVLVTNETGRIVHGTWFAPFRASLGIVPEANWNLLDANSSTNSSFITQPSSLFWSSTTPSNTLQLTWQDVLMNRETDSPVSFQAELWPSGKFLYRYDLSRCGVRGATALPDGVVSNILVGASCGGNSWTTNALPANVTSMVFHPLTAEDATDPDRDGDGISTVDELFVHGTDPGNADTDFDGLSDSDELTLYDTDPLDPHTRSATLCDGYAVKIGDIDPFSCPEGSTNTVLEHVFYSGTTNGVFAYPQSDAETAVLRVSVSGTGSGELIVGDRVVPLLAPSTVAPALTSDEGGNALVVTTLLVQVARGEDVRLYLRGDSTLSVVLNSDDFAFGTLPNLFGGSVLGFVNFPNTVAETPCIHDLNARKKSISLPVAPGADALSCTWTGSDDVEVGNAPPRSAVVTGNFNARNTSGITYTLSHPLYLFGQTTYAQTVRFCPRPPATDPDDPDAEDPPWFAGGDGDDSGSNFSEHEERWCCFWGTCCDGDGSCFCGCEDESCCGGGDAEEDDGDFGDCPQHGVPYAQCAFLHAADYTNAVQNVEHLGGVLYIRDPLRYEQIDIDVPTEHRNCCPCPDHLTNHVAVAYKSYRLNLVDACGQPFSRTETSCVVRLAGRYPSSAAGDAELAFSRNGEIYRQHAKTVLGVGIESPDVDLPLLDSLAPAFGLPMTVCTNEWNAPELRLVTNVRLPAGNIHLELDGATSPFAVWYVDRHTWTYRKLLDSATAPVKDLSLAYWKKLMRRASDGDSSELPVYVTSSAPGSVRLVFRYWGVVDGRFVEAEAVQRITSVRPPLRFDVNRDGSIDDGDAAAWLDGRTFYYWTNEDTVKGDYVGEESDDTPNAQDLVVNGTYDLVNLFPAALDLKPFRDAWGNRVTYVVKPQWGEPSAFNFCLANVPWDKAGTIQTTNRVTLARQTLSAATLTQLPATGVELEIGQLDSFSQGSGLMVCEAKTPCAALRVEVRAGNELLYSYDVPMTIRPVKEMYSWYNFRDLSGDAVVRPSVFHALWEEHNTNSLVFLHGANVDEPHAEAWGDAVFKRTWLAGCRANFYNVDWRSNIGSPANYHENASNAFVVASQIASTINAIPGNKVIMAHSLGNMVVSSMIQDYGLRVAKYLMCNSAVPTEAYDTDESLRVPQLVHPDWEEYPTNSWVSSWHTLFKDVSNDDRKYLGWTGRFSNVLGVAVNFYSNGENGGDEVLQLYPGNDVGRTTGMLDSLGHYSWHKQEIFKGRGGIGGTDWSGWNVDENLFGWNRIQQSQALQMTDEDFKTNTVFYCYPDSMNSTNISLIVRAAHLAQGIPALTPPAGATPLGGDMMTDEMINLNDNSECGVLRFNGWPTRSEYPNRWLHSDMKDISYFYNFMFFQKVIEKGPLR